MSQQRICDECGEPIDEQQPYYTGNGQMMKAGPDGISQGLEPPVSFDFHPEHVPWLPSVSEETG